ncbi:DUF4229 domain-containing protein [Thermomonospora cellulosilytica]|uniref:Cytochrome c biogenesis factor n=1 Tax=Thermomonospora cellulosilytica TaxID=1411118 RepID=A0A7W3MT69_9ACTN|nr:DUF4229 domain-containing protein [Thermomonospora cellulosilytica]MBA9001419.1 cytochrome c biogenesis factor [Thermomonospora cellulosilytica]
MRSLLAYTVARLAVFAATAGILYLVLPLDYGESGALLILLALAVLISGIVSYVLLARRREEFSAAVVDAFLNARHKFEKSRGKED